MSSNPLVADLTHLAELRKGVDSWNQWRECDNSIHVNLSGAFLRKTMLRRADLNDANLSGANLSGADLSRTRLRKANLSGADLSGANLSGADLSEANPNQADLNGANLMGADLSGINLRQANLMGANLLGANLGGANLSGANLTQANLSEADLRWANLSNATLIGCILSRANLSGANLSEAALRQANLSAAVLNGAILKNADVGGARSFNTAWTKLCLKETVGLSDLIHDGASSVGTDTLALSEGRLPDEFLKGCGLSDWEIENAKLYNLDLNSSEIADTQRRVLALLAHGPRQMSPVFISYCHADAAFVDKLGCHLDKKGVRYWRDIKDATAGRLDKVIERGILQNPTLLLVLSKRAVESNWVEFEVDKAVELSKELGRDVLCPIALDNAWAVSDRMSGALRAQIKKYTVLDFSHHHNEKAFAEQFEKLMVGLGLHYRDRM